MFLEKVLGKLANIFQTKDGLSSWLGGFIWTLALIFLLLLFGKLKFLEVRWPWLSLFFLLSQTSVSALSRSSLSYLAFLWMPGGLGSHSQSVHWFKKPSLLSNYLDSCCPISYLPSPPPGSLVIFGRSCGY